MAAGVKTLLENPGELYWGSYSNDPDYHYGISLNYQSGTLTAQAVYILTNLDENEDPLITPDMLASCFTIEDLADQGIVLSDQMDDPSPEIKGWYCAEESTFSRNLLEDIKTSNEQLGGYLTIINAIMHIPPSEFENFLGPLDEITFFELQEELESIPQNIDSGALTKPLPFQFRLIGDALLGWENADEEDYR